MDALEEEQVTPGAGDRVQGGPKELRKSACACVSERALEFTLLGTSSVALGHHLASLGFIFFICKIWLWDPHGGDYVKARRGASTS